jgi:hypothetical protein
MLGDFICLWWGMGSRVGVVGDLLDRCLPGQVAVSVAAYPVANDPAQGVEARDAVLSGFAEVPDEYLADRRL